MPPKTKKSVAKKIVKPRKSVVRAVRALRAAPAPVSYGARSHVRPLTYTSTGVSVIASGCDMIGTIDVPNATIDGASLLTLRLSPYNIGGRLGHLGACYENFKFKKVELLYASMVPTSTSGSLLLYYDADVLDTPPTGTPGIQEGCSHISNALIPVFGNTSFRVRLDTTQPPRYVDAASAPEARLTSQGAVHVLWHGSTTSGALTMGTVFLDYEVEFFNPQLQTIETVTSADRTIINDGTTYTITDDINTDWYPFDYLPTGWYGTLFLTSIATAYGTHKLFKLPAWAFTAQRFIASLNPTFAAPAERAGVGTPFSRAVDIWNSFFVGPLSMFGSAVWSTYSHADNYPHDGTSSVAYPSWTHQTSSLTAISYALDSAPSEEPDYWHYGCTFNFDQTLNFANNSGEDLYILPCINYLMTNPVPGAESLSFTYKLLTTPERANYVQVAKQDPASHAVLSVYPHGMPTLECSDELGELYRYCDSLHLPYPLFMDDIFTTVTGTYKTQLKKRKLLDDALAPMSAADKSSSELRPALRLPEPRSRPGRGTSTS